MPLLYAPLFISSEHASANMHLAFTAFFYGGGECNLIWALVALCCTISLCLYVSSGQFKLETAERNALEQRGKFQTIIQPHLTLNLMKCTKCTQPGKQCIFFFFFLVGQLIVWRRVASCWLPISIFKLSDTPTVAKE